MADVDRLPVTTCVDAAVGLGTGGMDVVRELRGYHPSPLLIISTIFPSGYMNTERLSTIIYLYLNKISFQLIICFLRSHPDLAVLPEALLEELQIVKLFVSAHSFSCFKLGLLFCPRLE